MNHLNRQKNIKQQVPYKWSFKEKRIFIKEGINKLPYWTLLPVPIAEKVTYLKFKQTKILTQQLWPLHFFVNIIEIHNQENFEIKFSVEDDQILFLFMLKGSVTFNTEKGKHITDTKEGYFYMVHNGPGNYFTYIQPGTHIIYTITTKIQWIRKALEDFPNLKPIADNLIALHSAYNILPDCKITKGLYKKVMGLLSSSKQNKLTLESKFRMFFSDILTWYSHYIGLDSTILAFNIKKYIEEHYMDTDLGYNSLARMFFTSRTTLTSIFKKTYQISIHHYITKLRMHEAKYLIEVLHQSKADVCFKVGYNNISTFYYAYDHFFPPTKE